MATKPCSHLLELVPMEIPEGGCVDCLEIGGTWVHLRFCVTCEQIRCCDDSPNQHARKHGERSTHKVIRSAEPGEMWAYCYADDSLLRDVASGKHMR